MNDRNRESISKFQNGKFEAPGIKDLIFGKFRGYLWKMLLESKVLLSNSRISNFGLQKKKHSLAFLTIKPIIRKQADR